LEQFRTFVKNREASFLMSPVKVTARTDIPEAKLSTFTLQEVNEGEVVEVPRWVAEILEEENLVNLGEDSVEPELFRALQREKLQGPTQPSQLSKDLYLKLRRHLVTLRKRNPHDPHYEKIKVATQDLVTTRLVKMVTMAGYTSQPEPTALLSPEELLLYREIRSLLSEWRCLVLGEEKP
jgi:DNA replication factor GINS